MVKRLILPLILILNTWAVLANFDFTLTSWNIMAQFKYEYARAILEKKEVSGEGGFLGFIHSMVKAIFREEEKIAPKMEAQKRIDTIKRILESNNEAGSDIICLQELDLKEEGREIRLMLKKNGYETGRHDGGSNLATCIFYNKNKFELVNSSEGGTETSPVYAKWTLLRLKPKNNPGFPQINIFNCYLGLENGDLEEIIRDNFKIHFPDEGFTIVCGDFGKELNFDLIEKIFPGNLWRNPLKNSERSVYFLGKMQRTDYCFFTPFAPQAKRLMLSGTGEMFPKDEELLIRDLTPIGQYWHPTKKRVAEGNIFKIFYKTELELYPSNHKYLKMKFKIFDTGPLENALSGFASALDLLSQQT